MFMLFYFLCQAQKWHKTALNEMENVAQVLKTTFMVLLEYFRHFWSLTAVGSHSLSLY